MNIGRKWPPQSQGPQRGPGQPPTRLHGPGILQPKVVAAPQAKQPPAAPPVYRPQLTPLVLQRKMALQPSAAAPTPVSQRRANTAAPTAGAVGRSVIQRQVLEEEKFYKLHAKKKCESWNYALTHYRGYNLGKDKMEWLEIAKAIGCELPADIGHGLGAAGQFDSHVNDYIDSFIAYKVQPACHAAYGNKKRKALHKDLVL